MGQFWKTSSAIALATNMMPLILAAGPALQKSPSQAENQNVPSTAPAALPCLHVGFLSFSQYSFIPQY